MRPKTFRSTAGDPVDRGSTTHPFPGTSLRYRGFPTVSSCRSLATPAEFKPLAESELPTRLAASSPLDCWIGAQSDRAYHRCNTFRSPLSSTSPVNSATAAATTRTLNLLTLRLLERLRCLRRESLFVHWRDRLGPHETPVTPAV
jgi:hypothetical protein